MKLETYLDLAKLTQEAFAERVGVSQGTISRLMPQDGRPPLRRPSLALADAIRKATGGQVTANDFVGASDDTDDTDDTPDALGPDDGEPAEHNGRAA